MGIFGIVILSVVVFALLTTLSRAHEVFCVSFRGARDLLVRGSLPEDLRLRLNGALTAPDRDVVVRGFVREGELELQVSGATEEEVWALKSLAAQMPGQDFVRLPGPQPWWRLAGYVWLAWWMQGRDEGPPDGPSGPPETKPPKSNIVKFRP